MFLYSTFGSSIKCIVTGFNMVKFSNFDKLRKQSWCLCRPLVGVQPPVCGPLWFFTLLIPIFEDILIEVSFLIIPLFVFSVDGPLTLISCSYGPTPECPSPLQVTPALYLTLMMSSRRISAGD